MKLPQIQCNNKKLNYIFAKFPKYYVQSNNTCCKRWWIDKLQLVPSKILHDKIKTMNTLLFITAKTLIKVNIYNYTDIIILPKTRWRLDKQKNYDCLLLPAAMLVEITNNIPTKFDPNIRTKWNDSSLYLKTMVKFLFPLIIQYSMIMYLYF